MRNKEPLLLLVVVGVVATCGLVYELIAGTLASYLMGDTIFQFSTIIGAYLFAMGIGSWLSAYLHTYLLDRFIYIEYLVGVIGGCSAALLFYLFATTTGFTFMLYALVILTGILVGLEIPLMMRVLKENLNFEKLVSRIFTFDYIGSLLASLVFPILFIPNLGIIKTALFFGIINVSTGIAVTIIYKEHLQFYKTLITTGFVCLVGLLIAFAKGQDIQEATEKLQFPGNIIVATSSPYQRIVVTRKHNDVRLFLNNNLQFSSRDECRYHEALVHPLMERATAIDTVLVMGGGDGLAVRELLKYNNVKHIILVDLDAKMTSLFKDHTLLKTLNNNSLNNAKVQVINADAFTWLKQSNHKFDAAIIDFPDPSNYAIGKLYSNMFYNLLYNKMQPHASVVIQCTSPYAAKKSFWCIDTTLKSTGWTTIPYNNTVPSFGMWGYIMASKQLLPKVNRALPQNLKYYTSNLFNSMCQFTIDMLPTNSNQINKLNNQYLVTTFEKEWDTYLQQ